MLTGVSLQTRMDIHGKVCIQRLTGSMVNLNREWSGFGFNNSKNDNDNYNALLILIHIRKSRIFIIYIPSLNLLRYISWVESVQMKYRILSPGCNEDTVLEDWERIEMCYRRTSNHGYPTFSVIWAALNIVQVRIHPIDVPVNILMLENWLNYNNRSLILNSSKHECRIILLFSKFPHTTNLLGWSTATPYG